MFAPLRHIAPQLAGGKRAAAADFLAARGGLLICALFLLAGLAAAGDFAVNLDESNQRHTAEANLNYILGRADRIEKIHHYHDRVYGVAFELPLLLAERALGLADYHYVHRLRLTLTHLFFIVGAFCCYRLAYHLFGSRPLAMLALLIFLLHPRIYAHSFFNSKDPVFLALFMIALYLLERAFRRDTAAAFTLLGVAVGLLVNLRIMGIMLLPAVVAMRGLDWLPARDGTERRHILRTGGLFIAAAGLTIYALSPYAWANPVDYLTTNFNLAVNHPTLWPQLFQGKLYPADQVPPHYAAVWFGITTPPLILLLGFIGIGSAVAQGIRQPGAVFRNSRLRFAGLLLAAFLLPPLAAALLGASQYDGWRHFYFLYAPFALLAALGGGWLLAALSRRRRWRAGMYALAAAGLGLTLLQLAQLHPLQYGYFNFLADRTTPDNLRTRYEMDYWQLAHREGLEYLLERHPGTTLGVRIANHWHLEILPAAARQRLLLAGGGGRADYELLEALEDGSRPDLAFNSRQIRLYDNPIAVLRPLDAAYMTAAAKAAYQELYRQAVAGAPIIRADYNVYRKGQRLTFVKENCPPAAADAWFGVRPFPPVAATPPAAKPPAPEEFFSNHRVQLGDICLAIIQLPAAVTGDIILTRRNLGGFKPEGLPVWEGFYSLSPPGLRELSARGTAAGPEGFAVFLDQEEGRNRLLYAKGECSPAEYETLVFLHIYPENLADLPFYRWAEGKENRDFALSRYGVRPGGECLAAFPMPDYPAAALRTGQEDSWEVNLYPAPAPERLRAAQAALAGRRPAARSDFALYLRGNRLVYGRESCAAEDTAAGFFLHIVPEDAAVLPAARRAAGFDNWDFAFERWGGHFDGQCLAAVPLPGYPIAAIRTGQAGVWSVDIYPPADPGRLAVVAQTLAKREPAARGVFDLYLRHNRLIYWRESCAAADTAAGFLLHIIPRNAADLPAERQDAGFANQDFAFEHWGAHFDGKCLASVPLPDYPVKAIRAGQHLPGEGELWVVYLPVE